MYMETGTGDGSLLIGKLNTGGEPKSKTLLSRADQQCLMDSGNSSVSK